MNRRDAVEAWHAFAASVWAPIGFDNPVMRRVRDAKIRRRIARYEELAAMCSTANMVDSLRLIQERLAEMRSAVSER